MHTPPPPLLPAAQVKDINDYMVHKLTPLDTSPLAKGAPDGGRRPSPSRPRAGPEQLDNSLRKDIAGSRPCRWAG
jgi:hypothetical protein